MSINPFDEIAIEEALRIKEQGKADEVIVVTIGTNDSQQQLRTAMAMGADRAVLVDVGVETAAAVQPLQAAQVLLKVILKVIEQEQPGLVITGKQAIDDDNNQTAQMLATLWNRPQATFASKIEFVGGNKINVTREVDAGLETIQVELPAVVSTDLRLNEPRFVKLPDIMKAKRKPLDVKAIAELVPEPKGQAIEVLKHEAPLPRQKGVMVETVDELIEILQDKGLAS